MNLSEHRIGVWAPGTIGGPTAALANYNGNPTRLGSYSDASIEKGRKGLEKLVGTLISKRREAPFFFKRALSGIEYVSGMEPFLDGLTIVIESGPETMEFKRDTIRAARELLGDRAKDVYYWTTTSALNINEIAGEWPDPGKVLGFHVINAVLECAFMELFIGEHTSKETWALAQALGEKWGKAVVPIPAHLPGGHLNHSLFGAHALGLQRSREVFDFWPERCSFEECLREQALAMSIGANWPLAAADLPDFVGLDTSQSIWEVQKQYIDPRVRELVAEGHLGKKTGKGLLLGQV